MIEKKPDNEEKLSPQQKQYSDKVEMLRVKQGLQEPEPLQEAPALSRREKFLNNLSYYKLPIIISAVFLALVGYLVFASSSDKADISFMLLDESGELYDSCGTAISQVIGDSCGDLNDDGKNVAAIRHIQIGSTVSAEQYQANRTKLFAEFKMGKTVLVVATDDADVVISAGETLLDLSDYFSNPHIRNGRLYLEEAGFGELIGCELPDDLFLGVRAVSEGESYEKEMRSNVESALNTIEQLLEQLSE